jgi:septal ring factor EnvC (AmiA/AmiB activator)
VTEQDRTEKHGLRILWSGKTVGNLGFIFAGIITLVSSFTAFAVTHYLDEATVTQKQNDRLDNLDQRLTKLEAIAETNTEARIQMQAELKTFENDNAATQHQILENQKALLDLLQEHERATQKRLKNMSISPEAALNEGLTVAPLVTVVGRSGPPGVASAGQQ